MYKYATEGPVQVCLFLLLLSTVLYSCVYCCCLQYKSAATASVWVQPEFLGGNPHRKHPGVTNLKSLRLPRLLQTGALCLIHSEIITSRSCSMLLFWLKQRPLLSDSGGTWLYVLISYRIGAERSAGEGAQTDQLPVEQEASGGDIGAERESRWPGEEMDGGARRATPRWDEDTDDSQVLIGHGRSCG